MEFTRWDIVLPGIFLPFLILLCLSVLVLSLISFLGKRHPFYVAILPGALWVVVLISGLACYSEGFTYPTSILLHQNALQYETIGEITDICVAPAPPLYYSSTSKTFTAGKLVTVNEEEFYIIDGNLDVGQYVSLIWTTDEHVVLAWHQLSHKEALPFLGTTRKITETMSVNSIAVSTIGKVIVCVGIATFFLVIIFLYFGGRRLSNFFIMRDTQYSDGVTPNRYGLLIYLSIFLPLVMILLGLGLTGSRVGIFMSALVSIEVGCALLSKQTTTLFLSNDQLYYKKLGHQYIYSMDSISFIQWKQSRIPHNRCLVITFTNKLYISLEQENYYGLSAIYSKLSRNVKG